MFLTLALQLNSVVGKIIFVYKVLMYSRMMKMQTRHYIKLSMLQVKGS